MHRRHALNLHHLAIFHAVARLGSVTGASKSLHLSQPAVSRQVRELESRLGQALIERLPRGVRLTEAGEVLARYADRLFALESEAESTLADLRDLRAGTLSLGASTTVANYLLPRVLSDFHRQHPGVTVTLNVGNTTEIQAALLRGDIQLGFTEGFVEEPGLDGQAFFDDELVVIAAPSHRFAPLAGIRPADLAGEPFVAREPGSGTRAVLERHLTPHGVRLREVMALSSTEAIKRTVASGVGIAVVSRLTVLRELEDGHLVEVSVEGLAMRRPLHRLKPLDRTGGMAVQAFLGRLGAVLEKGLV